MFAWSKMKTCFREVSVYPSKNKITLIVEQNGGENDNERFLPKFKRTNGVVPALCSKGLWEATVMQEIYSVVTLQQFSLSQYNCLLRNCEETHYQVYCIAWLQKDLNADPDQEQTLTNKNIQHFRYLLLTYFP